MNYNKPHLTVRQLIALLQLESPDHPVVCEEAFVAGVRLVDDGTGPCVELVLDHETKEGNQ